MYVTAFYVHWCIVVIHLGNCVPMRHWTPRGQHTVRRALHQSLGGFWALVQNHEGSEVRRLIWAVVNPTRTELTNNYKKTSSRLLVPPCCVPTLSLKKKPYGFSEAGSSLLLFLDARMLRAKVGTGSS